jgi:ATP-dependent DNA helicase RecQ
MALLRALLAAGWIDLTTNDHPVPFVTRAGIDVMKGAAPARLVLPVEPRAKSKRRGGDSSRGPKSTREAPQLDPQAQPVFELLRAHRAEVARAKGVPAYVVAHDRTLVEMAMVKPRSTDQLLMIHGMGPGRAEQYGEGFLRVLENV